MRVSHFDPPGLGEAAEALRGGVARRAWLVFLGECLTEYEGRAASRSTYGDRLVVIKPSGSVLVHGPRGYKPLNWQPDTQAITVEVGEGELVVRAYRRRPREVLVIRCRRVYHIVEAEDAVEGEFWMYINEHEIRDAIASNPELLEPGFRVVRVERPVEPGFIDLYGVDSEGRLVVVELKRVKAGREAVHQLVRYVEALRRRGVEARPVLAAPDFTESAVREAEAWGVELKRIDLARIYELLRERSRPRRGTLEEFLS